VAINRTLDFYTQMGPGDVILAGYFEDNPESTSIDDALRVTPSTCQIEEFDDAGDIRYRLTLPGSGDLKVAGVCMECSSNSVIRAAEELPRLRFHRVTGCTSTRTSTLPRSNSPTSSWRSPDASV